MWSSTEEQINLGALQSLAGHRSWQFLAIRACGHDPSRRPWRQPSKQLGPLCCGRSTRHSSGSSVLERGSSTAWPSALAVDVSNSYASGTYWTTYPAGGGTRPYILTGLGASLGFRNWIETRGAYP